jgi:hypothetical protein
MIPSYARERKGLEVELPGFAEFAASNEGSSFVPGLPAVSFLATFGG